MYIIAGLSSSIHYGFFTMAEIITLKVLYIFHFSRIAVANEYFVSTFIIAWNILVISMIESVRLLSGELSNNLFVTTTPNTLNLYRVVNLW